MKMSHRLALGKAQKAAWKRPDVRAKRMRWPDGSVQVNGFKKEGKGVPRISRDEYDRLLKEQGGGCYFCGRKWNVHRSGKRARLCIDHDHETGQVRGLLCYKHNWGIGGLMAIVDVDKLVKYLKRRCRVKFLKPRASWYDKHYKVRF